ncbi:MAG TPA: hypothetical protein VN441_01820, partial [Syntrophomonas sp.]|nr:hypothetical protein [Syntrophomonas sp.]
MSKEIKQKPKFTQPITKLIMPSIPVSFLKRPRLNKLYQDVIKRKIVLVTAPAGYGKTTFLSEALAPIEHPVAWISLDRRDDHIFDFWNNIIMAIQRIEPSFGEQVLINLQKNDESMETVLTEIINEIIETLPDLYIVLDDYHYIESRDIHASIEFLMDYLPPRAHLIISSRVSPPLSLNRLRGRGYVSEIKTNDLRFTMEETAELLNDVMAFSLNKSMIQYVYSRMEGWIAGLQMVVLTMQENTDVNALLAAFKGSDNDILEYLTSEVLNQQEERVRDFLLETSILDHFNGEMCNYIFERNDSRQLLDILIAKNLFLQSIDHEGSWFRYHSLFRDALQKQLNRQQSDILAWHKRASSWFEREGLMEDAIEHALEAGEFDRAISLLEKIVMFIMGQDKYRQLWAWIKKLPDELVSKSMWANIGCAVACENTRQPEQQQLFTQVALSISETMATSAYYDTPYYTPLLGFLYTLRMLDAYHKGDVAQAIKHADDGLEAMPENETRGRCGLLCVKEFALWKNGELMAAYRCSEEAAHLSKVVGWTYAEVLSLSSIAHIRFALGRLNSAAETCRQIQSGSLLEGKEISSCCYACLLLAQILYQWNYLDEAEKQVLRAISQSENGQEPVLCLSSQMALARIYIIRGKADAAIEIAQHAKLIYEAEFPDSVLADIFMTRLWIMRGD